MILSPSGFCFPELLASQLSSLTGKAIARLSWAQVFQAFCLGIGYLSYILCIMGGVAFSGPVVVAAFIGTVPAALAILNNARTRQFSWTRLSIPVSLLSVGLLLVNIDLAVREQIASLSAIGLGLSLSAVAAWLTFSILKQRAFERAPDIDPATWTGLMMTGAGLAVLLLIPLGLAFRLFNLPSVGLGLAEAGHFYARAVGLAIVSSGGGAWESCDKTLADGYFRTIDRDRNPTLWELTGIILLVTGAIVVIRVAQDGE
ncbi:hypothetical protein GOB44_32640 [Sinorhizobium meliloti]|nr:hypothetical protein [Sinorhizobium meliloti]MDW9751707.1 hypothetical protein [Sinorhizobium meliloti]MDX0359730.1 hypothetical protein [Sinorhizobium meliloti]